MVKVIMKQVPRRMDSSLQHDVMRKWSAAIVENHTPNRHINIISGRKKPIDSPSERK